MPNIDIELKADLKSVLDLPACADISLPFPSPLKIQLPSGGRIQAIADVSKGIPTDCAMTFSLMMQVAPLLASMECLLRILKLLKPLIDVISNLPVPPVRAVQEFVAAAGDLTECLAIPTPLNIIPFVRDLLCLVLKVLKCLLSQLKSLAALMGNLTLQLNAAKATGNLELLRTLECSMKNAQTSGQHLKQSIEPIGVLLDLAGAVMGLAGVEPIKLPALGDSSSAEGLNEIIKTLQGVVGTIQVVADGLGGCQ
jgi:hypothetical protein